MGITGGPFRNGRPVVVRLQRFRPRGGGNVRPPMVDRGQQRSVGARGLLVLPLCGGHGEALLMLRTEFR